MTENQKKIDAQLEEIHEKMTEKVVLMEATFLKRLILLSGKHIRKSYKYK